MFRYMRVLYDCYRSKLDLCNPAWSMWVAQHSTERSLWYSNLDRYPVKEGPQCCQYQRFYKTVLIKGFS